MRQSAEYAETYDHFHFTHKITEVQFREDLAAYLVMAELESDCRGVWLKGLCLQQLCCMPFNSNTKTALDKLCAYCSLIHLCFRAHLRAEVAKTLIGS